MNLTPLYKYPDFRLLYIGQFVSWFGSMLTYVALPYQMYQLTHSTLAVGNIGIVELIPLLITSLWGGALADKFDRRKLLLYTEFVLALTSGILLLNASLSHPHVWVLYLIAAISSAFTGFHRPALEAITQKLVQREDMPAVSALKQFLYGINMIAGPAIAGFVLAKFGLQPLYGVDVVTYLISFTAIFFIKARFVPDGATESIVQSIKEGFQYAISRQELIGTYLIDFAAMIFGMPIALFPAIAAETFHGSSVVVGWLYAGPSFGMLIASFFSDWTSKIHRHGVAISISATIWGLAIIAFGFSKNIYLAVALLAIAGGADAISGLFRTTMWNQTIPSHLRGRLAGIEMISYMSGPLLGNAEAGMVAAAFGTTFSVVSGGFLCVIAVAVLVLRLPHFWRYSEKNEPSGVL